MLRQYLEDLGFNTTEAKLYLALAELGRSTATLLSKNTSMPRSTVYSVLEALIARGVVSVEQTKGATFYLINDPSVFLRMLERERDEIKRKEISAKSLIELVLPHFRRGKVSIPRLQFFEGRTNIENMIYQYLPEWRKSLTQHEYAWWGYQDPALPREYPSCRRYIWATKPEREKVHLFSNWTDEEEALQGKVSGRTVRALPHGFSISNTIYVLGDFIVVIISDQQPHYAFQLHEPGFALSLRTIFQALWKLVEDYQEPRIQSVIRAVSNGK